MKAHLFEGNPRVTRNDISSRHLPLGEAGALSYRVVACASQNNLFEIATWLDASNSPRYAPTENRTFCNVYAHDFCYLAGVYLPRSDFSQPNETGKQSLQFEYTSNDIICWLEFEGAILGWQRTHSLTSLQEKANKGSVCIITAHSDRPSEHGHISIVLPETNTIKANRIEADVNIPVQSMAGRQPRVYSTDQKWWLDSGYQEPDYWFSSRPMKSWLEQNPTPRPTIANFIKLIWPRSTQQLDAQIMVHLAKIANFNPVSQTLVDALVAGEDRRFYGHNGFDLRGIGRAIAVYLKKRHIQGASTIEQQLVRTLTQQKQRTFQRKFKEIALAYYVSKTFEKRDLASVYLWVAYYGWRMNDLPSALRRLQLGFSPRPREACDLVACLRYPLPKFPSSSKLLRWQARSAYIEKNMNHV